MSDKPQTQGTMRRALARRLSSELGEGQKDSAALDARLLAAAAFGIEASDLLLHEDRFATAVEVEALQALADRRVGGEPVARILGQKEFWSLPFRLSPDTLVPRPDTEILVGEALAAAGAMTASPLRILDIGTGSGAILLALLSELPSATGIGTDMAEGALRAAAANAEALGLAGRCDFLQSNWGEAASGPFHLIVSNPPYIASAEIAGLDREVRLHDPALALDGGQDGLDAYRAIIADMPRILASDGRAFLEIGAGQAGAVEAIAKHRGYSLSVYRDLSGHDRVVGLVSEK